MTEYRIIVIEDDLELQANICTFMSSQGFRTTGVASAAEFYEAAEKKSFDLAIVDIGLPDRNDYEITKYLREKTNTRIVILTARGNIDDKLKGYAAGADAYFVKPVDSWELKGCITSILDRYDNEKFYENTPAAPEDEWLYDSVYLTLKSPTGKTVNLTSKESIFLEQLIISCGCNVERATIFNEFSNAEGLNYDNSALDILVTRLRKRVKDKTGEALPVRTIRSVGYCFFAPVRVKN